MTRIVLQILNKFFVPFPIVVGLALGCGQAAYAAQPAPPESQNSCPANDTVCLGATSGSQYRSNVGSPDSTSSESLVGKEGYIWIGNLKTNNEITLATVADGERRVKNLSELNVGHEYSLLNNLDLRENQPNNDNLYFRGQRLIALLHRGRKIVLMAPPVPIQRSAASQLWARVRVSE